MTAENIDFYAIKKISRWDGSSIGLTKECSNCPLLVIADRHGELIKICSWGIAWKIINEVNNPKSCQKFGRLQPRLSGGLVIK